jgi:hypothetical protein
MSHLIEATPRQLIIEAEVQRMARYAIKPYKSRVIEDMKSNNTSGVTGVIRHKASGKWTTSISQGSKKIYLGLYADKKMAIKAVKLKKNLNNIK